jgi:MT0933-like antitoxin protein
MVEPGKITEKATELAGQAAAAAGPLKEKAEELIGKATVVAGTAAGQAAAAAGPMKEKAEELVGKAAELAAQGISAVAEGVDKVTGGKFSDQISAVSSKIEDTLTPDEPKQP